MLLRKSRSCWVLLERVSNVITQGINVSNPRIVAEKVLVAIKSSNDLVNLAVVEVWLSDDRDR